MEIKQITERDSKAWSEMRTALWPDTPDAHYGEIANFFNNNAFDIVQVFMAFEQGFPIGFIELNIRSFAEGSHNAKVPYVEGWYVKPDHQGQGVGQKLMARAEKWATSLGYKELASDTELENKKSIGLHLGLGFEETERVVCFLKRLHT